jgi:glycerol-3-phosphate O-acyltransferase/dihydroxyacetone phosphate acyltransferase
VNPILIIIYRFLKWVVRTCLRIYYPDTTYIHPERLDFNQPTILVSNHPNTLLDPLNVAKEVPMYVHFLANASLFKGAFQSWFFNTFYCIPIERPQDTNGRPISNKNSFEKCDAFLGNGGCLYIAPEGSSFLERKLRSIKTGTARIALSAEDKKDFQLGLTIQAVGLTYEQANYFRSRVTINAGTPILISDYQEAYQKDKITAVRQLTQDLETHLSQLIIDVNDEEEDQLLLKIDTLLRNSDPLSEEQHFYRSQKVLAQLQHIREANAKDYQYKSKQVDAYFEQLNAYNTTDQAIVHPLKSSLLFALRLLLGLPLFLYGLINNALPVAISLLILKYAKVYIGYNSSVKIVAGLVFFPLFYVLQTMLINNYIGGGPFVTLYLVSLYPAGIFAWKWWQRWKRLSANQQAKSIRMEMLDKREQLMTHVNELSRDTQA